MSTCFRFFWHDDVIKGNFFSRCWLFVRGVHRSPVNSPHKYQWRGALMLSLICAYSVNNRGAGDLRRHRAHYDVTIVKIASILSILIFVYCSDYLFRLIVIGDSGVGKSSLLMRFAVSFDFSYVKSLRLIWRSANCKWNLQVPDLQMCGSDLTWMWESPG